MPQVGSAREAGIAFVVWLALGLTTILVHEERVRLVTSSRQNTDIYTDKRKALWRSNIWHAVSLVLFVVFLIFGLMMSETVSAYLLSMEANPQTSTWWAIGLFTLVAAGAVMVGLVVALRYRNKIKEPKG